MNFRIVITIGLFIAGLPGYAQGQNMGTGNYYTLYTLETFREGIFRDTINLNNPDYDRIQAVLFFLTNEVRVRYHLTPVVYSQKLSLAAQMHARDMVEHNFFSHINDRELTKKTPNDRARLIGISNPMLAENIIEGYGLQYRPNSTIFLRGPGKFSIKPDGDLLKAHTYLSFGESLIRGWMASKDHKKNILANEAVQLGCGAFVYIDPGFNNMPTFLAVQNFQWHKPVE